MINTYYLQHIWCWSLLVFNLKEMKTTIKITDFTFAFSGYGHYKVTYTSPCTRKEWSRTVNDMETIDATKNCDQPKIKDLNLLKSICKGL